MSQYKAKDIQEFQYTYNEYVSHIIVAHTKFRPYNSSQYQIDNMVAQSRKNCRYALSCFARLLYPNATNKPIRQPLLYKPLTLVTIENTKIGLGREQTIHFNIALGNLPKELLTEEIESLFKHAWVNMAQQAEDVKVYDIKGKPSEICRWLGYSLKEAQQQKNKAWQIDGTWDVENCWIPHAALSTD